MNVRSIQYKFLHRLYMGNIALFAAGLVTSDGCKYCSLPETFFHIFWECEEIQDFWITLWIRVQKYFPGQDAGDLDICQILFGTFISYQPILLLLTVIAKKEIICARWTENPLSVDSVWNKFLYCARVENLLAADLCRQVRSQ